MYNNFTLRAFLTGVNSQLSHLLRCRDLFEIEAIQMVIEENFNYHRAKIGGNNQNKPPPTPNKLPPFQLRINQPQTRQPTAFTPNFTPTFNPPQQKWTPKPFPNKQPNFPKPNFGQQTHTAGSSQQKMYKPTPMEVDSNRTRISNQSIRPYQNKYKFEHVTTQEIQQQENDDEPDYNENEYYSWDDQGEEQQEAEDENFRIPASSTQNVNQ